MKSEVIIIDSEAYARLKNDLLESVIETVKDQIQAIINEKNDSEWVSSEEARKMLNVGKTKFQELKNSGEFKVSQQKRKMMVNRKSLLKYLEKNVI
jgi:ActR/RegA family two-component response regulator